MANFAIKSKRTIMPGGTVEAVVLIKAGLIADILPRLPDDYPHEIIDVGDKVLMAGIIDPHVHINEPGRTEWEGFDTATKSAIAGGLTTLIDMPLNSSPVTTTVFALEQKLAAAKNKIHTNCGFWAGLIPGNQNEIEPLIAKGISGFKAFLTHSGIDEFPNVTEDDLRKAMPVIARYNLPLLAHCELVSEIKTEDNDPANRSYQHYLSSRPKEWEDNAIALMIRLCEEYNCPVHIVHLSSANSIDQVAKAKQKGLPLTAETAQHYLYFNAEDIKDGETAFKCAPPIRERENNELLWSALKDGIIDFVATDHSPSTPSLKELQSGDFTKAWGGIASLQFALPVLWTAALKHNAGLHDLGKWLSANPAKLIGKEKSKGSIQKGYDADLIVWNPEKEFTVTETLIYHRHKVTPYLNGQLKGVVELTFLNGEKVFEDGKFLQLNKGKIIIR